MFWFLLSTFELSNCQSTKLFILCKTANVYFDFIYNNLIAFTILIGVLFIVVLLSAHPLLTCVLRLELVKNLCPHQQHVKGFKPVCTFLWLQNKYRNFKLYKLLSFKLCYYLEKILPVQFWSVNRHVFTPFEITEKFWSCRFRNIWCHTLRLSLNRWQWQCHGINTNDSFPGLIDYRPVLTNLILLNRISSAKIIMN